MAEYPALDRIERLTHDLDRLQRQMSERVAQLQAEDVDVVGDSGLVRVSVDHAGHVKGVDIDPRGLRLGSERLGTEIADALRQAQERATGRLREALTEALGPEAAAAFED